MKVGLVPAFTLAFVILLLIIFDLFFHCTFDPPYLQFILNLLFITGTGLAIAFISGKSYLNDGSQNVLLLGCAVLVSGLSAFFSGWASTSANTNMTVFNIGIFVSSFLQLSAAHVTVRGAEINWFYNRKVTLTIFYVTCLVFVVALTMSSVLGLTPPFFTITGPTVLDEVFLGTSVLFFSTASIIFVWQYLQSKSRVLYWYSLALVITSTGLFGSLFVDQFSGALSWVTRLTQYIGGFYFLIALFALRNLERQDLTFAGKWQEAFAVNRKQIAKLFSKMLNGLTYCKIVTNSNGKPIDWIYIDVNDAFEEMAGRKKTELIGRKASELYPGIQSDPDDWVGKLGQVALTGESVKFEQFSKPQKRWYNISAYSPKKGYLIVLSEDITERKKAEKIRREAEEKHSTILETSESGYWLFNLEGKLLEVNQAYSRMSGYSQSELLQMHIKDVEANESHEKVLEHIRVLQKNGHQEFESCHKRKDGTVFDVDVRASCLGAVGEQFIGFMWDITERKKIEEELANSEMKYRRLYETSLDGIIARNLQGRMIDCNQAYAKMLGYSKNELKDHSYTRVLPEKWHEHREVVIKTVLETGHSTVYEREYIRKDGSIFPGSVRTWRLTDDKGEVLGVWSIVRDITELKESQKKLEQYSKQLEQLVEERTRKLKDAERLAAIGETAGMVGHDIRNPLQSIIAEVYLSKDELASLPESENKANLKESLNSIENQAMYINKIVADLQDYTKLAKPQIEEVDLQTIIQDALATIPIPENVKTSILTKSSLLKIKSDPHFLKRILTNLSLNAVQAMPNGGELTLTIVLIQNKAAISVKDTGAGIPEEAKKNLFKPLFTTKPKGQGFGLAVAKKLTESLNGTITFESEKDKGTTFTITLPQKTVAT
jgi:PAS domain S-box-containing protein